MSNEPELPQDWKLGPDLESELEVLQEGSIGAFDDGDEVLFSTADGAQFLVTIIGIEDFWSTDGYEYPISIYTPQISVIWLNPDSKELVERGILEGSINEEGLVTVYIPGDWNIDTYTDAKLKLGPVKPGSLFRRRRMSAGAIYGLSRSDDQ